MRTPWPSLAACRRLGQGWPLVLFVLLHSRTRYAESGGNPLPRTMKHVEIRNATPLHVSRQSSPSEGVHASPSRTYRTHPRHSALLVHASPGRASGYTHLRRTARQNLRPTRLLAISGPRRCGLYSVRKRSRRAAHIRAAHRSESIT